MTGMSIPRSSACVQKGLLAECDTSKTILSIFIPCVQPPLVILLTKGVFNDGTLAAIVFKMSLNGWFTGHLSLKPSRYLFNMSFTDKEQLA